MGPRRGVRGDRGGDRVQPWDGPDADEDGARPAPGDARGFRLKSRPKWEVTGEPVKVAFVDQGSTGEEPASAAAEHGIRLEVVKLPEAKHGFVLLPRRWVVDRSFGWVARFRRLARASERLSETLEGLHSVAFVSLMLHKAASLFAWSS